MHVWLLLLQVEQYVLRLFDDSIIVMMDDFVQVLQPFPQSLIGALSTLGFSASTRRVQERSAQRTYAWYDVGSVSAACMDGFIGRAHHLAMRA